MYIYSGIETLTASDKIAKRNSKNVEGDRFECLLVFFQNTWPQILCVFFQFKETYLDLRTIAFPNRNKI